MTDIDPRATEQERAALLDSFFEVDKDSDGLISRDEMLASMARALSASLSLACCAVRASRSAGSSTSCAHVSACMRML